jgi:hypothetical protein
MTYNRKWHGRIDQVSETTGKKILCRNSLNDGQATHITEGFSTNSRTCGNCMKNRKDETDRKTKLSAKSANGIQFQKTASLREKQFFGQIMRQPNNNSVQT